MKYCTNCGAPNDERASECDVCHKADFRENFAFSPQPLPAPAAPPPPSGSAREKLKDAYERGRRDLAELEEYIEGDANPRVIFMFGFSMSGKSFFTARAKDDETRLGYNPYPLPPMPKDADAQLNGIPLPGTVGIERHVLRSGPKGPKDIIVLLDVEGELFHTAAENHFVGANDLFLEAIAHADGFIFMLPAAETIMPQRWERENPRLQEPGTAAQRIKKLRGSIETIASFVQFVTERRDKGARVSDAVQEFLKTRRGNLPPSTSTARSDKPALVLLSKADKIGELYARSRSPPEAWRAFYDGDPMGRLANAESAGASFIIKEMHRAFKRFRIDFVTAFHGHNEFPAGYPESRDIRCNMNLPHYGVAGNFNWLKDQIDMSRGRAWLPAWLRKLDPGVLPAIAFRRMFDPQFARVWSDGRQRS